MLNLGYRNHGRFVTRASFIMLSKVHFLREQLTYKLWKQKRPLELALKQTKTGKLS